MSKCKCYAKAVDPERQKILDKIFYEGKIPIKPSIPYEGKLAGQDALFYLVDFERVSHAEKEGLIDEMSERFNLAPVEVRKDIENQGAPIKADGVIVSWCPLHVRCLM